MAPNEPSSSSPPPSKKAKKGPGLQSNLFAFFASNIPPPPKAKVQQEQEGQQAPTTDKHTHEDDQKQTKSESTMPIVDGVTTNSPSNDDSKSTIPAPMIPKATPTPRSITWQSLQDHFLLFRRPAPALFGTKPPPRSKVAALDLDGTLVVWTCAGWPSTLQDYELWNSTVPNKLRQLYDDGYRLLLVSNQAAIQKAHQGKKAQLVQNVINWIGQLVDRPMAAILSTQSSKKEGSFHKPNPKLWQIAQQQLGETWDITSSFFVGDSADPNDAQGGVDAQFAKNVATLYAPKDPALATSTSSSSSSSTPSLTFYTPTDFFGLSDREKRQALSLHDRPTPPPSNALQARAALLGGYWQGPILLLLCGVQGSGKSTFATSLVGHGWVHLSQDTIQNGHPGKREQVEAAARQALQVQKCNVVIDRMHLTIEQRRSMIELGMEAGVPVHVLVLTPPTNVITVRVRERINHPGKVQGPEGVKRALQSIQQLVLPTYQEPGITLISVASTPAMTTHWQQVYSKTIHTHTLSSSNADGTNSLADSQTMSLSTTLGESLELPRFLLGTMGIGKRKVPEAIPLAMAKGIRGMDTAPTYNNENELGIALHQQQQQQGKVPWFCIAKIPKSAVYPEDVRTSLTTTLQRLQRSKVDLLLLHWPCESQRLIEIWKEMEACCREGHCQALGVCNFTVYALAQLLPHVTISPVVNQVERHPLLAQWELLDFCSRYSIHLQAHTPLGQGRNELLGHAIVEQIAKETSLSPAAVVLQWNLQHGVSVVPKVTSEAHWNDLLPLLRQPPHGQLLTPDQMKQLDTLDCGKRYVAPPFMYGNASYCWGLQRPS